MIANAIDKDPFILFNLKDLDKDNLQNCAGIVEDNKTIIKETFDNKFVKSLIIIDIY